MEYSAKTKAQGRLVTPATWKAGTPSAPSTEQSPRLAPELEEALLLIRQGYTPVFLPDGQKAKPLGGNLQNQAFQESLRDPDFLKALWQEHTPEGGRLNLAVALGGLIQVDADTLEAVQRVEALDLPETPSLDTPKKAHGLGGRRWVFRDSIGLLPLGKKSGKSGTVAGLEWSRGATMYGLVAPSRITQGNGYAGDYVPLVDFEEVPPLDLGNFPELVALLKPSKAKERKKAKGKQSWLTGTRNDSLTAELGFCKAATGAGYETLVAIAHTLNAERCKPPLPKREVEEVAKSVSGMASEPWVGPDFREHLEALQEAHGLSSRAVSTLRVLRDYSNGAGIITSGPSVKTLGHASKVGGGTGTAYKALKELEACGLLYREPKGKGKGTRYEISWNHGLE